VTRELATLSPHPLLERANQGCDPKLSDGKPFVRCKTVDIALDIEHRVDPVHRLDSQRPFGDIGASLIGLGLRPAAYRPATAEHRRLLRQAAKWAVVTHIDPEPVLGRQKKFVNIHSVNGQARSIFNRQIACWKSWTNGIIPR
jgi:hypothetical protein